MKKMDWTLILGIGILVLGTFFGTYLIHKSNREANTKRIEALEDTFTNQNDKLKDQSKNIKKVADSVFEISQKLNKTTNKIANVSTNIAKVTQEVSTISKNTDEVVDYIKKDIDNAMIRDFSIQIRISHLGGRDMEKVQEKRIIEPYYIEFWQEDSEKNKNLIGFGECYDEFNDIRGNKLILTYDETVIINSRISFDVPGSSMNSKSELDKKEKLYFKISNLSDIPINLGGFYTRVLLKLKRNQQPFEAKSLKVEKNNFVGYFENINY